MARFGAKLAGAVQYTAPGDSDPALFQPEWASIRMLSVHPELRGQGIARALMAECLSRARNDAASTLALHTNEVMTIAREMYERMGFTIDRELGGRALRTWVYTLNL